MSLSEVNRELTDKYMMRVFGRDLMLVKGSGSRVWDDKGNEYIDCVAGIAVCSTGHCHPKVVEAICSQAKELIHVSNLFQIPRQGELSRKLVEVSGIDGGRAFFANSGAEANDAAIKLAIARTGRDNLVAFREGFHGRTIGSLSATYKPAYRDPFKPLLSNCEFVDYGDLDALEKVVDENVAAVFVEPIQGEAGIIMPPAGFLEGIREICDNTGALMICDEVQTGFGRTGKWFGFHHSTITPDIISMAKGIASGFPMGAIVAREGLEFNPGEHGGTYIGSPLACAASLATIEVIEGVLPDIARKGERFRRALSAHNPRVLGLMIGINVGERCAEIQKKCREDGLLINCASTVNIRLVPPLVITDDEIDQATDVLNRAI